jgi:hypothetical protein
MYNEKIVIFLGKSQFYLIIHFLDTLKSIQTNSMKFFKIQNKTFQNRLKCL